MKQTLCSIVLLFIITFPSLVQAGEVREIVLIDGSVIVGELLSLANGIYTIKTATVGTVQVEDAKVETIRNRAGGTSEQVKASGQPEISSIQQEMISDGYIMQLILALQNDPDFQDILQDESIITAINDGDLDALMTNPKIEKLMRKSDVQEIKRRVE